MKMCISKENLVNETKESKQNTVESGNWSQIFRKVIIKVHISSYLYKCKHKVSYSLSNTCLLLFYKAFETDPST